jgi:predicted membrane metal-binding protein
MQGILYEEPSFWLFLLVTCIMGGWAAWMTGRAFAKTWRAYWQAVLALLLLAGVVRFIHYALFEGTLLSLRYYVVDALVVLAIGSAGFRFTRARQMARQYSWLYERAGPFSWREKPQP